eukprot:139679-Pyramimonas_sp.AAC.1
MPCCPSCSRGPRSPPPPAMFAAPCAGSSPPLGAAADPAPLSPRRLLSESLSSLRRLPAPRRSPLRDRMASARAGPSAARALVARSIAPPLSRN